MSEAAVPFQRFYDLGDLSEAGAELTIAPSPDDLLRLAEWLEVAAVKSFTATIRLRRLSPARFGYAAQLEAEIVQSCVVTLEPVQSHIVRDFARELHLVRHRLSPKTDTLTLAAGDDDAPEEIDSPRFDVAGPVLEELSLSIDPYPRAPGVAFEAPSDSPGSGGARESPFAVLERLKRP